MSLISRPKRIGESQLKEKNQGFNMIFILGIVLLIIGVMSLTITQQVTRYRNVFGFQVPYKVTIHPYEGVGAMLILVSIILIGASIYSKFKK